MALDQTYIAPRVMQGTGLAISRRSAAPVPGPHDRCRRDDRLRL